MGDIIPFEFEGISVRVVEINGDPWMVLADVCKASDHTDPSMMASRLAQDEKGTSIIGTPGGPQEMVIISWPGVYKLAQTSRKPRMKRFDRWVRHEVLEGLRKRGHYSLPGIQPNNSLEDTIERAWNKQAALINTQFATQNAVIAEVKAEVKANTAEIVSLRQDLGDLAPRRKKFSKDLQSQYRWTCLLKRNGECCCGCGKKILDPFGNELENYRIDHLNGRHRVGPKDGLPVDKDCNQEFENNSSVRDKRLAHRSPLFHEDRETMFPNGKFEDPYQTRLAI